MRELRLENFRGFADHTIPLQELSVLVGRNNAGKSTAIEALRLVGDAVRRFRSSANSAPAPEWLDDPRAFRGVTLPARDLDFDERTFFHAYGRAPAVVTATFVGGESVNVFIGQLGDIHAVARARDGHAVATAAQARALELPDVRVQPQLGPVAREERILREATIQRGLVQSPSIHFRNQLNLFYSDFARFSQLVEENWPGLRVVELQGQGDEHGTQLQLLIRDGDFAADVGLMGHGLQMWLQTIWFLARVPRDACVVLDEPDVYMHPDLQHRLLARIEREYKQILVATHSVEIISTVDPESLVIIERAHDRSRPLLTDEAAQTAIEALGGVHNLHVARLYRSERFLLVEGRDVPLLAALQIAVVPDSRAPLTQVPTYPTYGWGGWHHAIRSTLPRKNGEGKPIATYALFDSDFHTDEEIAERFDEAKDARVRLHVWRRKEIENYLLIPEAIARLIERKAAKPSPPSAARVAARISEVAESLRQETIETLADELSQRDRGLKVKGALVEARLRVGARWDSEGGAALVSGKTVLSELKKWSMSGWGVSFSAMTIARELHADEVDAELRAVFEAFERRERFPERLRRHTD